MVRNILPLASLTLTLGLTLGMGAAQAEDTALVARVTAAAEKVCPTQVYDGPKHLFYPMSYKAEHETCVRLVTRSTLAKIAATNGSFEQVAQK